MQDLLTPEECQAVIDLAEDVSSGASQLPRDMALAVERVRAKFEVELRRLQAGSPVDRLAAFTAIELKATVAMLQAGLESGRDGYRLPLYRSILEKLRPTAKA